MLMSLVGRLEHDRAGGAEHRIAGGGDELALIVDLQAAVAGVALAGRRLHHQEAVAVDRDVERVLGLLGRALREIVEGAAVLHVARRGGRWPTKLSSCAPELQIFLEQRLVGLVAVGVDVRDVVGDDIHLPFQRHLPRKSDEKRILHRWFSPSIDPRHQLSQAGLRIASNRQGSPKPRFASSSAKAVPSLENARFSRVRCFAGVPAGRQKGLVDHVCPATFS